MITYSKLSISACCHTTCSYFLLILVDTILYLKTQISKAAQNTTSKSNIYLSLAECEVHTESYGPIFFLLSFYGPSAKRADYESKEGKNKDP